MRFPLDSGVTGQYLACSVTGKYHKPSRKSCGLWEFPASRSEMMSLQESIALQNPLLARTAAAQRAVCTVSSRRSRSEQPAGDVPDDAQPRGRRQCAESARRHLLRTARLRRPDRDRGDASEPAGGRLHPHPRHSFGRAGQGLARGHRGGASCRQQDLRPALACRTRIASGFPRRRAARCPLRPAGGRRSLHHPRTDQIGDPARARDR